MPVLRYLAPIAALALLLLVPRAALAARSTDSCTGFIDTLPVTLGTPGTWCLRGDLSTAITSGAAITVTADDVTVDCNDFKLGNQAAGPATTATGVLGSGIAFTSIRNCSVRGFFTGIRLSPSPGTAGRFLVEDNRFDGNTYTAVYVYGGVIRRNTVVRTGRSQVANVEVAYGIHGDVSVIVDNTVQEVAAVQGLHSSVVGIWNYSGLVRNNHVSGLVGRRSVGIDADYADIRGNIVQGPNTANGAGIEAWNGRCRENIVAGFEEPLYFCADLGNTKVAPPPPPPPPEET